MSQVKNSQSYIDESRASALLEKWSPVLDYSSSNVKSIEDDHTRLNTAILLENQENWCIEESGNTSAAGGVFGQGSSYGSGGGNSMGHGGALTPAGDNYAQGDARLPKILIPMIRRTFPELITNEIVGVQPMSGPVGLAFALRYKYGQEVLGAGPEHGDKSYGSADSEYGSGKGENSGNGGTKNEAGYQFLDSRFTGAESTGLSGSTDYSTGVTGGEDFEMLESDKGVAQALANYELRSDIPTMEISFEKTAVEAGTRRLAARWSVELEQDLKNMNGIDIDTELTNAMSYEIQAEIDREMIMRMVQVALNAGPGKGYSSWSPTTADGRWMAERNRDLYAKIIVEANRIAVRNRRGAANFLIATPKVCAILEMLPEFQWMQVQGSVNTQPVGIARVGNLGGRFNVYRDTRTEAQNPAFKGDKDGQYNTGRSTELNYVLLGYKGPEFYDTGIIYCPYIPVMVQRTIGPNDFAPRVGLLTRYGVVDNIFGADLYYHLILIKDIGTPFTPGTSSVYM
jgi:hypothetical protein